MFVVLCIFCYEETCSFLAHYTKDVPISSIPFCLPVFARHMQGVPTALLQKILPHLRDIDKKSLDLNSKKKKKRAGHTPTSTEEPALPAGGGVGTPCGSLDVRTPAKGSLPCVDWSCQMETDKDSSRKFSQPKSCIARPRQNSQRVPASKIYNHKIKSSKLWKHQHS